MNHQLQVAVSISRMDRESVELTLVDESSRAQFLVLTMTSQNFLNAVMGLGHVEGVAKLRWLDRLGTKHENKTESIPADNNRIDSKWEKGNHGLTPETHAYLDEILAPYEVDGWMARRGDFNNMHRRTRKDDQWVFEIAFHRYVPVAGVEG